MQTDQPQSTQNKISQSEQDQLVVETTEPFAPFTPKESVELHTLPTQQSESKASQSEISQPSSSVETKPSVNEQIASQSQSAMPQPVAPTAPTVAPVQTDDLQASAPPTLDDTTLASIEANDAELIEKEWVDKADEIIAKRANDPASEDDAVADLSQAYIKNRFHIDIEDAQ